MNLLTARVKTSPPIILAATLWALLVYLLVVNTSMQGQRIQDQYYPSATANGGSIVAYVVDDPMVLFQCQLDAVSGQDDIGSIVGFASAQHATTSGSTTTGNSTMAVDATVQTTVGGLKLVGFVSPTDDTYPDVLVKFTTDGHSLTQSTGV